MTIGTGIIIFIIFLGFLLYYLLTNEPPSDLVYSSHDEDEINVIRKYLTANGIKTYIKNRDGNRLLPTATEIVDPSLHVVDTNDYKKAIELIQSHEIFEKKSINKMDKKKLKQNRV